MKRTRTSVAAVLILCASFVGFSAGAATLTVTTSADETVTNDPPSVSLREAIISINNGADTGADVTANRIGAYGVNDTINFNIPGGGVKTFSLGSGLPSIIKPVTINGYTQGIATANTLANSDNALVLVELDGEFAGGGVDGLVLGAGSGGSLIEGLSINRFSGNGVHVLSSGNAVEGNFIGVNASSGVAQPNSLDGVRIEGASNNGIGGTSPANRNVISGNTLDGVRIMGTFFVPAAGNTIQGNFVGVNAAGTGSVGVRPSGPLAGTAAGNFLFGIEVSGGYSNTIGGSSAGARNVVGFNTDGIELDNGSLNNVVQGNFCGVGSNGVTATGNILHGIVLRSSDSLAAPFGPGQPNEPEVSTNTIGGTPAGSGNLIEFNGSAGVAVFGNPVSLSGQPNTGNGILGNSIFQNGRSTPATMIGIDLSNGSVYPTDDGVTANDSKGHGGASDPNNFQNFPVLASATSSAGSTTIVGSLSMYTLPNTTFRIEFFSSSVDPMGGVAEGQAFLGFNNLTTDSGGNASFSATLPLSVAAGRLVTATATTATTNNTSEFSAAVTASATVTIAARGDFNGDGKTDILLRNIITGDLGMWLMNGFTITSGALVGSPGVSTVAGVGDFNGDGKADILLRDNMGNLGMWLMNGSTIASGAFVGSPGGTYTVAAVADFNGDGKADILLRDNLGNLGMWIMNGPVITSGALVGSPGAGYNVVAAADFNGDGKADILLRDNLGNLGMWIMNGPTITSGALVGSPGGSYSVAGAADYNGDGKADILLRDSLGNLGIWFMNGATVTSGASVGSPGAYSVAGVGNYDGDPYSDILLRSTSTGDVGMWLMNGATITSGGLVGPLNLGYEIR